MTLPISAKRSSTKALSLATSSLSARTSCMIFLGSRGRFPSGGPASSAAGARETIAKPRLFRANAQDRTEQRRQ